MRTSTLTAASLLGLTLVVGCSTPNYKAATKTSNSLADVKTELITDKANLQAAVDNLHALVYAPNSDLRPQYDKFAASVATLEKSAASQASARSMVKDREAYMSKWKQDISMMPDADLRLRAQERIGETDRNFGVLSDKLNEANNSLAPLVNDLKALSVYLGSDLTANGIKSMSDRATRAKNQADVVNPKIDDAIEELDKVSDEIAPMPTTQPMAEPMAPATTPAM